MSNYSIIVLSQNEETNIGRCISSCVSFSDDVWLVDSYSTDQTVGIAMRLGANVVEHKFESWGKQRNYALANLQLKYDYVLFLDADEQIDEAFSKELSTRIETEGHAAFNVNFDILFLGKVLKYAHENPPVLRVVKKGAGHWQYEGAREYCVVRGTVGKVKARIRHEDRKGIFFWLTKHIRNADREAEVLLKRKQRVDFSSVCKDEQFERPRRVWIRRVYNKLPPILRPLLVFVYRYFVKLGFLDGYPGLVFCLLQVFWYNLIVDVRLSEIGLGHDSYLPVYGGEKTILSNTDNTASTEKKVDMLTSGAYTPDNIRSAFITTHFPPSTGFGGVTESSFGLSSALARAGSYVRVVTSDATASGRVGFEEFTSIEEKRFKIDPFRHCINNRLCFSLSAKHIISDAIKNSDIVHVNGIYTYPVTIGARIAKQLNKPYIIALRGGLEPWGYKQKHWKKHAFFNTILKPLLRTAGCMHVTSENEMDNCIALGLNGPYTIIPNGINPECYMNLPAPDSAEEIWPCLKNRRIILFLSRLSKEKGLDMLLRVWGELSRKHNDILLVIAGPDDRGYEKNVRKMIRQGKLSQSVTVTGNVTGRKKLMLYSRSDLFILPSYSENFGNVVAEALACGVPVITTKATPWQDINKYDCGRWVPINEKAIEEALVSLLNMTSAAREAMGKRGRELINKYYTWDMSAGKMITVYQCVLEGEKVPLYPKPVEV